MCVYNHTQCVHTHANTYAHTWIPYTQEMKRKIKRETSNWSPGLTFLLDVKVALHGPLAGWSVVLVSRFHPLHQSLYLLSSTFKVIPCLKGRETTYSLGILHQVWGTSHLKSQNCQGCQGKLGPIGSTEHIRTPLCWAVCLLWVALVETFPATAYILLWLSLCEIVSTFPLSGESQVGEQQQLTLLSIC